MIHDYEPATLGRARQVYISIVHGSLLLGPGQLSSAKAFLRDNPAGVHLTSRALPPCGACWETFYRVPYHFQESQASY